jgi:spermidine dehydrogenase
MVRKTDRQLGMDREISRRDFLQDSSLAALGMGVLGTGVGQSVQAGDSPYYPPTRNGLRGSHPGSYETAHALARGGAKFSHAEDTNESYDLVVVGGGISGLASAWFYRKTNPAARILILENHDEFGGHARRNEFHQGGVMRLAWGGTFNLEYHEFSNTVSQFIEELGINVEKANANMDFQYGTKGRNGPSIWFDEASFGTNKLVTGCSFRRSGLKTLAESAIEFPISAESRESLITFAQMNVDITEGMSAAEVDHLMHGTSFIDFLILHGGVTPEAANLFVKSTDGYWGVSSHSLSVSECIDAGLPILHLLGRDSGEVGDYEVAMFPDGNASVTRMIVRSLIPAVGPGNTMNDIVSSRFDYAKLDLADAPVRLRLNSTVVNVLERDGATHVSYVSADKALKVKAKKCILACNHGIIPYLCPQMPEEQKEAQKYQVRRPLILTNVLLRNSKAHDELGITGAFCPGRLHAATWLCKGIESADYHHDRNDDGPVAMMFWGMPGVDPASMDLKDQHRAGQSRLMAMSFKDIEREVRTVCDGMLSPGGFDVKRDILAITANRWPHGYAYDYLDLWDPDWPEGEAPHEIARKPFGNIAIANSDAGADAYSHVAIDQAWRAVKDLSAKS